METVLASIMGYLIAGVKNNETLSNANKEISEAIWNWVRPLFLKDEDPIIDFSADPDDKDNQKEVEIKIKKHLKKNPNDINYISDILKKTSTDSLKNIQTLSQIHYGTGDNIGGDKIGGDKIIN